MPPDGYQLPRTELQEAPQRVQAQVQVQGQVQVQQVQQVRVQVAQQTVHPLIDRVVA